MATRILKDKTNLINHLYHQISDVIISKSGEWFPVPSANTYTCAKAWDGSRVYPAAKISVIHLGSYSWKNIREYVNELEQTVLYEREHGVMEVAC